MPLLFFVFMFVPVTYADQMPEVLPVSQVSSGTAELTFNVNLADDYEFTDQAPSSIKWESADFQVVSLYGKGKNEKGEPPFPVTFEMENQVGETELTFNARVYFCRKDSTFCLIENRTLMVPVEVVEGGPRQVNLEIRVQPDQGL